MNTRVANAESKTPAPVETQNPARAKIALMSLVLVAATLAVYARVAGHGFVALDDADYVSDNRMVQAGLTWTGVKWAFTTGHASNWHPLTWLSHMLDAEIFGSGPRGPHVVNLLLHAANVPLLFALLRRLTGALWRSAAVAALFGLHPLHVESVAWIAERKDVLSAFFFLLTLWAYARYAQKRAMTNVQGPMSSAGPLPTAPHWSLGLGHWSFSYNLALLLFACGLMSKPMVVTLPCVLLLLDYWPLRRWDSAARFGALVKEKIPFFALTALSCIITFVVQRRGGAVETLEALSLGQRAANAVVAYVRYLAKTVWPADLAVFYPHPGSWPIAVIVAAAVLLVVLAFLLLRAARRFPYVTVGGLWFAGMLVPTLGLVQVGLQAMADRYTYLPLIGVFVALAWAAGRATQHWRGVRLAVVAVGLAALVGCAAMTYRQVGYWRDSERLFTRALAVTERNFVAHNSLGHALREQGRAAEAVPHFRSALAIWPRFPDAQANLGHALLDLGDTAAAIEHFRRALEARPDYALAHYNLGTTLLQLGQVEAAITSLGRAAELRPDDPLTHLNLGNARLQQGQSEAALKHYRAVLALDPDHADAHNNSGSALLQLGRVEEAIARFRDVVTLQPDHANAHFNLGDVLLRRGDWDGAIRHFERVLALAPEDAEARRNLAIAREQRDQARGASRATARYE